MMERRKRIALVGVGKIALDQHVPAIMQDSAFELVATVDVRRTLEGIPGFTDFESLLAANLELDAVSLCTPPAARHGLARVLLDAGLHVMLEKPPAASVSEAQDLVERAAACGLTLFATWHSREAAGVGPARDWLAQREIRSVRVIWKEDIRRWHPGQSWILEPGGFGVFDPAVNAFSILTAILPQRLTVRAATLHVPVNRDAPIAAELDLLYAGTVPVSVDLDFLESGDQRWEIEVRTDEGTLLLAEGGHRLLIDGVERLSAENREYACLYRRFADLIAASQSDVDLVPLQLVADAFLIGRHVEAPAFHFESPAPASKAP